MLYELMAEGTVQPRQAARVGIYGRNLARDLYWAELVLRREGPAKLVSFPSRAQILKDALLIFSPRHRFDVQQWRDMWPGIVDAWHIVRAQVERVLRIIAERRLARRLNNAWRNGEVARRVASAHKVLFVCYGNINRSILAERYFCTKTTGMSIACTSAGFHENIWRPADPMMVEAARQQGIDLTNASSKRVSNYLIAEADVIFVMEHRHFRRIAADFPESAGRTFLLSASGEIDDPYGKSPEIYVRCLNQVTASIDYLVRLIRPSEQK